MSVKLKHLDFLLDLASKKKGLLRACPFCGGLESVEIRYKPGEDGWRTRYFVLCDYDAGGCGAAGGERHSVAEAVDCWNERRRKYRGGASGVAGT